MSFSRNRTDQIRFIKEETDQGNVLLEVNYFMFSKVVKHMFKYEYSNFEEALCSYGADKFKEKRPNQRTSDIEFELSNISKAMMAAKDFSELKTIFQKNNQTYFDKKGELKLMVPEPEEQFRFIDLGRREYQNKLNLLNGFALCKLSEKVENSLFCYVQPVHYKTLSKIFRSLDVTGSILSEVSYQDKEIVMNTIFQMLLACEDDVRTQCLTAIVSVVGLFNLEFGRQWSMRQMVKRGRAEKSFADLTIIKTEDRRGLNTMGTSKKAAMSETIYVRQSKFQIDLVATMHIWYDLLEGTDIMPLLEKCRIRGEYDGLGSCQSTKVIMSRIASGEFQSFRDLIEKVIQASSIQ